MVKIYFLGGEDIEKRYSKEINQRAFLDAGGTPNVLIFNWTSKSIDKPDKYTKIMTDYFKELGASKIEFAELSDSLEGNARKAKQSDLIYLPGGFTRILVKRLRSAKVDGLLRNYDKIIVGNSAGALALCKEYVLTKDKENSEIAIIKGLGLVDFSIKVHYDSSTDDKLKKLSKERRIFAIPERSALVYNDGDTSFIGDVYLFHNGKKTAC